MDPIWDRRGKRWLDPVTKRPIDPKKPQILPLDPPKKKKKEPQFIVPEFAKDRENLVTLINEFEDLL